MNPTRIPKEVPQPDLARRGTSGTKGECVQFLPDHISWREDGVTRTSSDSLYLTLDYVGLNVRMTSEWRIAEGVRSEVVKVILDRYYACVGTE
jgi:hypothetical protein